MHRYEERYTAGVMHATTCVCVCVYVCMDVCMGVHVCLLAREPAHKGVGQRFREPRMMASRMLSEAFVPSDMIPKILRE